MKSVLIFFVTILFCTFSAQSAAVLWNEGFDFSATSSPDPESGLVYAGMIYNWGDEDEVYNSFGWYIELLGGSERQMAADVVDVGRGIRIITAEVGDEINHETAQDMSRVFVTNYGEGSLSDLVRIHYNGDNPVTLYFGIQADVWGTTSYAPVDWNNKVYGWFELFVDNYTMTLGNTCLDLSGRPVIVGVRPEEPIPEPATGALALLGAAMLFRRHRRTTFGHTLRVGGAVATARIGVDCAASGRFGPGKMETRHARFRSPLSPLHHSGSSAFAPRAGTCQVALLEVLQGHGPLAHDRR